MSDCIFCKIANGEFNTEFVYENEFVAAFRDLNPVAPNHILVIPKAHVENLNELKDEKLMAELLKGVQKTAEKLNIKEYRTVINTGKEAGQTVFHLHIHIISGRPLLWPPG